MNICVSFQLLAVNLQCSFSLIEVAVRQTFWGLEICLFRAGSLFLYLSPGEMGTVQWGDAEGPAGGKWHCLSGEANPLQTSSYQLCRKLYRYRAVQREWAKSSDGGADNISRRKEERWLTSIVPLSYDVYEQDQVAGIINVNHMAISAQFQVWRSETIPKASAIFLNIPLTLWKVS